MKKTKQGQTALKRAKDRRHDDRQTNRSIANRQIISGLWLWRLYGENGLRFLSIDEDPDPLIFDQPDPDPTCNNEVIKLIQQIQA